MTGGFRRVRCLPRLDSQAAGKERASVLDADSDAAGDASASILKLKTIAQGTAVFAIQV